jgi:hypothetical protein
VACLSTENLDRHIDSSNEDFPFRINRYKKGDNIPAGKKVGDDNDGSLLCVTNAYFTINKNVSFAIVVGSKDDYENVDDFINNRLGSIQVTETTVKNKKVIARMVDTRSNVELSNDVSLENNFKNADKVAQLLDTTVFAAGSLVGAAETITKGTKRTIDKIERAGNDAIDSIRRSLRPKKK